MQYIGNSGIGYCPHEEVECYGFPHYFSYEKEFNSLVQGLHSGHQFTSTFEFQETASRHFRRGGTIMLVKAPYAMGFFSVLYSMHNNSVSLHPVGQSDLIGATILESHQCGIEKLLVDIRYLFPSVRDVTIHGIQREVDFDILATHNIKSERVCLFRDTILDISEGIPGYLRSCTSSRRASMRSVWKKGAKHFECEIFHGKNLYQRFIAIEKLSKKALGMPPVSAFLGGLNGFCRDMLNSHSESDSLVSLIVKYEGRDVAYNFGFILGHEYYGFQTSYVMDPLVSKLSPGTFGHLYLIDYLNRNCRVSFYNMGKQMDYKKNWSPRSLISCNIRFRYT